VGTWSQDGVDFVAYSDRLTHIWTDTDSYLVAVHVQGAVGVSSFAIAEAFLTREFRIRLP
jgi:hypothetical protein